jgi:hypothetical protein
MFLHQGSVSISVMDQHLIPYLVQNREQDTYRTDGFCNIPK